MATGLNSLATIIKRLEAATSRLEDLAITEAGGKAKPAAVPSDARIAEQVVPTPPAPPAPPPAPSAPAPTTEDPPSVATFDEAVIHGALEPWLKLTRSFTTQSVIEQAGQIEKMYQDLRTLLVTAAYCRKPDEKQFEEILKPLQLDIATISKTKEANRKDREWYNHLSVVAEGAPVVGWVASPKPGPHVKEITDSTQFWGDRVIKEFKEKDPKHTQWVRGYIAILAALRTYVVATHTTGLTWNARGVAVSDFTPPSSLAGGPPPPPPPPGPPPPPPPPPPAASAAAPAGGIGAVFADLNRGEDVTKGLRKVDKSEMTHKNPELRAQAAAPATPAPASAVKRPVLPRKPQSLQAKKPAKFALEGNKWLIEYQEGETLTVENTEISQIINLFGCKKTTVIIKGKVNAVTLVNCTKTSVLVESVISSISVTASPSFTLQITGNAPTIQLDTTDSGQIYLSKACIESVEIITAKCSSINVSLPVEGEEEGVFEEKPVPEMLRTVVKGGKLVTTVVEHTG